MRCFVLGGGVVVVVVVVSGAGGAGWVLGARNRDTNRR